MTRARQAGFTLMEVLVALALLGFVVVGLSQGQRLGLQAWDRQARRAATLEEIGATERLIRDLLEQTEPGPIGGVPPLRGLPGAVSMRSVLRIGLERRSVEAALGVDARRQLVLRWTPRGAAQGAAASRERVLLTGIDHLELWYHGDGTGWQREWHSAVPPRAIRVEIAFAQPARRWPPIVVSPRLEGS